jgi:hypothetical protein
MSVYASYLPRTVFKDQQGFILDFNRVAYAFEYGKDPLSLRDKAIAEKDKALAEKTKEIEDLKKAQEEDFVPRLTKEKIEENFKILEVAFKKHVEANAALETELHKKREYIRNIEADLREKVQQYQFLVAEYRSVDQINF